MKLAEQICDELKEKDIIIRDGNLQATVTNEKKYFDSLYDKANKQGVVVAGLCKTSSLFTDKAKPVSVALNRLSSVGK